MVLAHGPAMLSHAPAAPRRTPACSSGTPASVSACLGHVRPSLQYTATVCPARVVSELLHIHHRLGVTAWSDEPSNSHCTMQGAPAINRFCFAQPRSVLDGLYQVAIPEGGQDVVVRCSSIQNQVLPHEKTGISHGMRVVESRTHDILAPCLLSFFGEYMFTEI